MNDNPLVAQEQDSTQGYTGIGIAESVTDLVQGIQSGNWVDIGLGGLTTGLEALSIVMDPIGSVASNLVSFVIEHVEPLQDALDKLAGKPTPWSRRRKRGRTWPRRSPRCRWTTARTRPPTLRAGRARRPTPTAGGPRTPRR